MRALRVHESSIDTRTVATERHSRALISGVGATECTFTTRTRTNDMYESVKELV